MVAIGITVAINASKIEEKTKVCFDGGEKEGYEWLMVVGVTIV